MADAAANIETSIVRMLTGLSKEERRRIIQFIAAFFEVSL